MCFHKSDQCHFLLSDLQWLLHEFKTKLRLLKLTLPIPVMSSCITIFFFLHWSSVNLSSSPPPLDVHTPLLSLGKVPSVPPPLHCSFLRCRVCPEEVPDHFLLSFPSQNQSHSTLSQFVITYFFPSFFFLSSSSSFIFVLFLFLFIYFSL